MPLPAAVQKHLEMKGMDISKMKPGVRIPKDTPGITINHDHASLVQAIRGHTLAAKKAAPAPMTFKKADLPSFLKKK